MVVNVLVQQPTTPGLRLQLSPSPAGILPVTESASSYLSIYVLKSIFCDGTSLAYGLLKNSVPRCVAFHSQKIRIALYEIHHKIGHWRWLHRVKIDWPRHSRSLLQVFHDYK